MSSRFTPKTVSFLRSLKRNNDREWFRARKADYERHVRGPMVDVIRRLAGDFRTVAPELVADPKVSLFRAYRDTRFSEDKTPLKTNVAARFPTRGFARGQGAGLYFEIAPGWVWIAGGIYSPEPAEIAAIRAHIAATHPRLHAIATARGFTAAAGTLEGARLTRVPRGYAADHPAAGYLRFKQFIVVREYDAAFAWSPDFYDELLAVFRGLVPLVRFLNEPLTSAAPSQASLSSDITAVRQRRRG